MGAPCRSFLLQDFGLCIGSFSCPVSSVYGIAGAPRMAEAGLHRHTVKDPWSSLSWLIWTLVALHILALGFWVR